MAYALDKDQLEKIAELFLNILAKKDPILRNEIERNKARFIQDMVAVLMKQKPELTSSTLNNKIFLKELAIAFVTTLTLNKLSLDKRKNFLEEIKSLLLSKDNTLLTKMQNPNFNTKSLEKLFTPQEYAHIQQQLQLGCAEILNDLKLAGLIKPTPGNRIKAEEEMSKELAAYSNLFGLVNAFITGGYTATVQCFLGNALGFTDWNPNHGMAQIDLQDKVTDDYGDPLALNASAMRNYLQFGGTELVEEFEKDLSVEGLAPGTAPRPHPPGTVPPNH